MNDYLKNASKFHWGPSSASLNEEKVELLDKYARGSVLDIGTGSGIYANYLTRSGHSVTAIDNQAEFVRAAKRKYPKVSFQKASAYKLPFKKNQFDTVVLFDVIEHLDDVKVLTEAMRVGKRLIISVPLENSPVLMKWSLTHHHYMDNTHLRVYSKKSLLKLLKTLKFSSAYMQESLPISISGLASDYMSDGSKLKHLILKGILKAFSPTKQINSAIFAVANRKNK